MSTVTQGYKCMDDTYQRRRLPIFLILLLAFSIRICGIGYDLTSSSLSLSQSVVENVVIDRTIHFFMTGNPNPAWFNYPTLYFYILFIIYWVYFLFGLIFNIFGSTNDLIDQYLTNPTNFYLLGRTINVIFGTMTVWIAYRIGERLYSRKVGIIGAFFLALTPMPVIYSQTVRTDIPMLFLLFLSFYFCILIMQKGELRHYIFAGIIGGLAMSTKYPAAVIIIPIFIAHILNRIERGLRLRDVINKEIVIGLLLLFVGFILGTPYAILDGSTFIFHLRSMYSQINIGLAQADENLWIKVFKDYLRGGMTLPLEILSICGVIYGLYRHKKEDILLITYSLAYYISMVQSTFHQDYYWLPLIPVLVILGVRLLTDTIQRIHLLNRHENLAIWMTAIFIISLGTYKLICYNYARTQESTRILAKKWIEENIPKGTKIVMETYGPPLSPTRKSLEDEYKRRIGPKGMTVIYLAQRYIKESLDDSIEYITSFYDRRISLPEPEISYYLFRTTMAGYYPMDYYKKNGFEYCVITAIFTKADVKEDFHDVIEFYQLLDNTGRLIKEFKPNFGRGGPIIKIYKIRDGSEITWHFSRSDLSQV